MTIELSNSRRSFLKNSAVAGGGLIIGFYLPGGALLKSAFAQSAGTAPLVYPPNMFIQIAADSTISLIINKCEMGQGVFTSMSQLIAEELDCDWKQIRPVGAQVDPVYNHTMFGPIQITGGSTALASSYDQYRKIGASARIMLTQAAAAQWKVDPSSCKTALGFVTHSSKGKLSYGQLAEAANKLPMPKEVPLRDPKNFKFIGKSIPRLDAAEKSTGKAIYGLDVRIPNMVRVMLVRPPVWGATLKSFDAKAAKKIAGVIDVVRVNNRIAILGKNTWAARQGRDAVIAQWNMNGKDQISSDSIFADYKKDSGKPNLTPKSNPDAVKESAADENALFAEYEFPYLAHAAMEPLNVVINYDGKSVEIWSGHQMPTVDRDFAAKIFGLPKEKVKLTPVYAGGSFGRRASKDADYIAEACEIAKVLKRPMQLVWSREMT